MTSMQNASIEQSIARPDTYFVKIHGTSITISEEELKQLLRSGMSTVLGKKMLDNYTKQLRK